MDINSIIEYQNEIKNLKNYRIEMENEENTEESNQNEVQNTQNDTKIITFNENIEQSQMEIENEENTEKSNQNEFQNTQNNTKIVTFNENIEQSQMGIKNEEITEDSNQNEIQNVQSGIKIVTLTENIEQIQMEIEKEEIIEESNQNEIQNIQSGKKIVTFNENTDKIENDAENQILNDDDMQHLCDTNKEQMEIELNVKEKEIQNQKIENSLRVRNVQKINELLIEKTDELNLVKEIINDKNVMKTPQISSNIQNFHKKNVEQVNTDVIQFKDKKNQFTDINIDVEECQDINDTSKINLEMVKTKIIQHFNDNKNLLKDRKIIDVEFHITLSDDELDMMNDETNHISKSTFNNYNNKKTDKIFNDNLNQTNKEQFDGNVMIQKNLPVENAVENVTKNCGNVIAKNIFNLKKFSEKFQNLDVNNQLKRKEIIDLYCTENEIEYPEENLNQQKRIKIDDRNNCGRNTVITKVNSSGRSTIISSDSNKLSSSFSVIKDFIQELQMKNNNSNMEMTATSEIPTIDLIDDDDDSNTMSFCEITNSIENHKKNTEIIDLTSDVNVDHESEKRIDLTSDVNVDHESEKRIDLTSDVNVDHESEKKTNLTSVVHYEVEKKKVLEELENWLQGFENMLQIHNIPISLEDIIFFGRYEYMKEVSSYDFSEEQLKVIRSIRKRSRNAVKNNRKKYEQFSTFTNDNPESNSNPSRINGQTDTHQQQQQQKQQHQQEQLLPQSTWIPLNTVYPVTITFQHPQNGNEIVQQIPFTINPSFSKNSTISSTQNYSALNSTEIITHSNPTNQLAVLNDLSNPNTSNIQNVTEVNEEKSSDPKSTISCEASKSAQYYVLNPNLKIRITP